MMMNICNLASLLLVLPSILEGRSGLRPAVFNHYSGMKTWKDAQSFCRENHADLVTIKDKEHNKAFANGRGWLGLYQEKDGETWKWSRENETATFLNWKYAEPGKGEHCAFKYSNSHEWEADYCNKPHSVMCDDEKLVLVKDNKTWEEALKHCRSLGGQDPGQPIYDLSPIITDDDHQYARERAQDATTDEVWTGLRYLGDEWFWVTGEQVKYQDIPSCPLVTCGVLEKSNNTQFGMRDCNQRRNFFCYKKV